MPELPEVETIRAGLERSVAQQSIATVTVSHPRSVRRHPGGPEDFAQALLGRTITQVSRRGKYLWLAFADGDALLAHLGMSGQFRVDRPGDPPPPNTRVEFTFTTADIVLRFVDQRMFGGLSLSGGGAAQPAEIAHIAADLLSADLDWDALVAKIVAKRSGIKRVLLDQTVVSGIGNIYADESLWRARLHYDRPANTLSSSRISGLLEHAQAVLGEALAAGGTSFDALYVGVAGESGYFERSLAVYGRQGLPCPRCGTAIVREPFMGRSSFRCPKCQPRYRVEPSRPSRVEAL
ncbi:MAG: bifunctional DNA-formamidopyrimidine glycosylase/DNA-(apurinic or apyrimidinic site) lyase [Propionibacteriaceae bacterium]|jgi:formamidopyrimidine-DNA glycosylase|nr:bifunctional DNA-formamidopyrimidine glycosylase/DNA-(apurinic or apyrimidinic site) lyase [Propionibacteriaceae bacterium]